MARPLRIQYSGALYHIISKGIDGRDIFCNDIEKRHFLKILFDAKDMFKIKIYLFCILINHYHITLETLLSNLSQVLHWINGKYTSWYNKIYERKGHVLQGRYKSIIVDKDEYLLELSRYIHLNPVKAGVVKYPEEYKWSSYRTYMGLESIRGLDTGFILNQFGDNINSARIRYKRFIEEGMGIDNDITKKLVKGFILGSEKFVENIEEIGKGIKEDSEIPQLRELKKLVDIDEFFNKIREEGIDIGEKGAWGNIERDILVYLCKRLTLRKNNEIGVRFGLTDAAVSYIYKKIESFKEEKDVKEGIDRILKIFDF